MGADYFPSTIWTEVRTAGNGEDKTRAEALNQLFDRYYHRLVDWLSSTYRIPEDDARDLLHDFHLNKIERQNLLAGADPSRGRFRNFLLECLRNYIKEQNRASRAKKRYPEAGFIPLEDTRVELEAVQVFDLTCVEFLLEKALLIIRLECEKEAKIFEQRTLNPILNASDPPEFKVLVKNLGLKDVGQAYKQHHIGKHRFIKALSKVVAEHAGPGADANAEIREFIERLSGRT